MVCAHDEAERLPATLAALGAALPGARIVVADDGSTDGTAAVARASGAEVVRSERNVGKGGVATLAARHVLETAPVDAVVLLCDGDLADTARHLPALVEPVRRGDAALAVGAFARRVGGGFGLAVGAARRVIRRRTGLELTAPISGQRALTRSALAASLPFAPRFGMEVGMTIDVARAGFVIREVELPLAHRATGRTWRGFVHRGRQLADIVAAAWARR